MFVVSLDFELHWGVRDVRSLDEYRAHLLGVRRAVPRILELFVEHGVHATWATVGLVFARDRAEIDAFAPADRPRYVRAALDPYAAMAREVGVDENDDPFHFGASLVEAIRRTPHQEIGTHTFSHYYCNEPGQTEATFRADLAAAARIAAARGISLESIVFPRNQVNRAYLGACRDAGLRAYRGNPPSALYEGDRWWQRIGRLVDAYLPVAGDTSWTPAPTRTEPIDIPASRFLRPYAPRARLLEPLRLHRLLRDLRRAARGGRVFHLWWHPHNFGVHLDENLAVLRRVLQEVVRLRIDEGLRCLSMGELARELAGEAPTESAEAAA